MMKKKPKKNQKDNRGYSISTLLHDESDNAGEEDIIGDDESESSNSYLGKPNAYISNQYMLGSS